MRTFVGMVVAAGALMAVTAGAASADEGAIKYRKAVYKALGGHTSALAGIVKGEVDHTGDAKAHAKAIGALAPMTKQVFPEGSDKGDTRALPAIWEKPQEFAKTQDAFIAAAEKLSGAADDLGALGAALGAMGKTCKSCHDNFRKEKN